MDNTIVTQPVLTGNPETKFTRTEPSQYNNNPASALYAETEELFKLAVEYRAKINESKTSVAKNLYAKKLKRVVAKLDKHIAMYSFLEQAIKSRHPQQEQPKEE